jgi:hypothetical protein
MLAVIAVLFVLLNTAVIFLIYRGMTTNPRATLWPASEWGGQLRSNTPLRKESPDLPGNSSGTGAE